MLTEELFDNVLEIATKNGYGANGIPIPDMNDENLTFIITFITSGSFITAMSKHIYENSKKVLLGRETSIGRVVSMKDTYDKLTLLQAIAIRDGKILEFLARLT